MEPFNSANDPDSKAEDMLREMLMHIQECPSCNRRLAAINSRGRNRPTPFEETCPTGKQMGIRYLEYKDKKGDRSATYLLDRLKEVGAYKDDP